MRRSRYFVTEGSRSCSSFRCSGRSAPSEPRRYSSRPDFKRAWKPKSIVRPWLSVQQLRLLEDLRNTGGAFGRESSSQPFAPPIVGGVRHNVLAHSVHPVIRFPTADLPLTNRAAAL